MFKLIGIEPKVLKMVIILGVEQATQSQPKPIEIDLEEDDGTFFN